MSLALVKPLIDAIQKLGRSLWYDMTWGSRACRIPAADIIKHLERICPVLGMACPGAAQVITLTDRPVPCQLANMESVLMICPVCLGREASNFCVMHTFDTIQYSATPCHFHQVTRGFCQLKCPGCCQSCAEALISLLPYHSRICKMHHSCPTIAVGSANIYVRPV